MFISQKLLFIVSHSWFAKLNLFGVFSVGLRGKVARREETSYYLSALVIDIYFYELGQWHFLSLNDWEKVGGFWVFHAFSYYYCVP